MKGCHLQEQEQCSLRSLCPSWYIDIDIDINAFLGSKEKNSFRLGYVVGELRSCGWCWCWALVRRTYVALFAATGRVRDVCLGVLDIV